MMGKSVQLFANGNGGGGGGGGQSNGNGNGGGDGQFIGNGGDGGGNVGSSIEMADLLQRGLLFCLCMWAFVDMVSCACGHVQMC